jgi:hypothetical protein
MNTRYSGYGGKSVVSSLLLLGMCGGPGEPRVHTVRRGLLIGGLAALAIAAVPAGAAAAPTRDQYIAQADPICQATIDAQIKAAGPKGFLGPLEQGHLKAAGRSMRRVFAALSPGVEQLAVIEPPAADAQLLGTWVQQNRAEVPLGMRVAGALIRDRLPRKLLTRLGKLNTSTHALVAGFGFHYCQDL